MALLRFMDVFAVQFFLSGLSLLGVLRHQQRKHHARIRHPNLAVDKAYRHAPIIVPRRLVKIVRINL